MIKSWIESLLIALSMYSALPVKCLNWTEKNLRNAMVFFPLVGLLCGVGLFVVWTVCELLHVGAVLFGVLAVLSGVLITGGIHLDGFCDTADALYSRRPQEEKLRILKDPNCGPFAVFSVVLALLVSLGAYVQIYQTQNRSFVWLLTGVFVLSRCLSGLSVTALPIAPSSSLAKTFGESAGKTRACYSRHCVRRCGTADRVVLGLAGGRFGVDRAVRFLWLFAYGEETVRWHYRRSGRLFPGAV